MTNQPDQPSLSDLPDDARLWVYAADRELNDLEEKRVEELLTEFCGSWTSHGRKVESAAEVLHGRFAVIAGIIPGGDVSGCGIDASVHALDRAASELALNWLPGVLVHYRDENGLVRSVPRREFRELVRSGVVTSSTHVFDLSLQTLGQLREGKLEVPAGDAWHARVFRIAQPAS